MAVHSGSSLLTLQSQCKKDPESYRGDFELQLHRYQVLSDMLTIKPDSKCPELIQLITFLSHVSKCFSKELKDFPRQLSRILKEHGEVLPPPLRLHMVRAMMLMHRNGLVEAEALLPLCFHLFECHDKQLRVLLQSFIVADIRNLNSCSRNDRLNRRMQSFVYKLIEDGKESIVKRAVAVLTELWRQRVWRDAHTVNVIAAATQHASPVVVLAALKFFLGQDNFEDEEEEDETPLAPTKADVYRATCKGTLSTRKKKKRKLKRMMGTLEKAKRKGQSRPEDSFAAMQLLHDPQSFADRLLANCQGHNMSFDNRLVMMQVISRVIGVHELILENFYPFVQRYLQPSQREVVSVLAIAVQSCHKLVPPTALQPVLKQVVDQFVHDRARPEVVTVGLKTVREMCLRCPLVMQKDLLSDLVLYHTERDKHVKNAAKALIAVFRELKPSMLEKKHRGRGADLTLDLAAYGAAQISSRVDGTELLEQALKRGDNLSSDSCDSDVSIASESKDDLSSAAESAGNGRGQNKGDTHECAHHHVVNKDCSLSSGLGDEQSRSAISRAKGSGAGNLHEAGEVAAEAAGHILDPRHVANVEAPHKKAASSSCASLTGISNDKGCGQVPKADSLKQLKKKLSEKDARAPCLEAGVPDGASEEPLEFRHILSQEEFAKIRKLKIMAMVQEAMAKHGLQSASAKRRLKETYYSTAEDQLELQEASHTASQQRLDPSSLLSGHHGKREKADRMASVMAGRADRAGFGSSVARKKQKTGGLSNVEKQKQKLAPAGAATQRTANRKLRQKQRNNPRHHRGRTSHAACD